MIVWIKIYKIKFISFLAHLLGAYFDYKFCRDFLLLSRSFYRLAHIINGDTPRRDDDKCQKWNHAENEEQK